MELKAKATARRLVHGWLSPTILGEHSLLLIIQLHLLFGSEASTQAAGLSAQHVAVIDPPASSAAA